MANRTMVIVCEDWEVACTGAAPHQPAVVLHANRVVATNEAGRRQNLVEGLRRREAQARCPEVSVHERNPDHAARTFEPILGAVESMAPGVLALEAGKCAILTRGPARYFGGETAMVQHFRMLVEEALRNSHIQATCVVGVADTVFAARLAAHEQMVVPAGDTKAYLANRAIAALGMADLVHLLRRLGLRTLGDLAALPRADVVGRFGSQGDDAHRRASGEDDGAYGQRVDVSDFAVDAELDPPVQRVDAVAFAAKALADQLHERLSHQGLACNQVLIEASTEYGETLRRAWRHEGSLTASAIADRARWQLEGWLAPSETDASAPEPTGGISLLRFVPEGLCFDNGVQLGFWGGVQVADERVDRALVRVQGLLGHNEVMTAVPVGGRNPSEQMQLVPWGEPRSQHEERVSCPWPGRLPTPSPATVYAKALPASVLNEENNQVTVSGRGFMSSAPAVLVMDGGRQQAVVAFAGPWPLDQRWWDAGTRQRKARLQLVTEDGLAYLASLQGGQWWVEAFYD